MPNFIRNRLPGANYLDAGCDVVVFDCETTGTSREDGIVSLGALRLTSTLDVIDALHLVFNPGRQNHPIAASVHGMSDRYLARQPRFAAHVREVEGFFRGAALVAHNLSFDARFVGYEFERLGRPGVITGVRYCTMQEWRVRHPGGSAKLDVVLEQLGLARAGLTHGALEDAFLAAQVLRWLHHVPPGFSLSLSKPTNER